MATILQNNMKIPLNFPSRTILILKPLLSLGLYQSTQLSFGLKLFNSTGDTLLYISVFKTRITFKDHANRSLGNGWGKEQTVDMNYTPTAMFGDTVSIHHYVTDSNFGRYQILVNGITVCHFDKRLPGSATQISYKDDSFQGEYFWGPSCWEVGVYQIGDLLPEDRLALAPGRDPLEIPSRHSTAVSIRPPIHSISNQAYATSISWDHGKEIRLYYLGPSNVLHEYAYSASKGKNSWYYGNLDLLKIVLDPTSSIAAIRLEDDDNTICIYYQDLNTNFIRMVYQRGPVNPWKEAPPIVEGVTGSSFAVVRSPGSDAKKIVSRIYYQDPELCLKECYYSPLGTTDQWVFGDFDPGVQPRGTPITAEVVQGGVVDINVTWRDAWGRVASSSWSKSSGWELPNPNGGRASQDGRG